MLKQNKHLKMMVASLTIILILAYAFIFFLPYYHECVEVDCAVCTLMEFSRNVLVVALLLSGAYQLRKRSLAVFNVCLPILPIRDGTPVGLKVKLSD